MGRTTNNRNDRLNNSYSIRPINNHVIEKRQRRFEHKRPNRAFDHRPENLRFPYLNPYRKRGAAFMRRRSHSPEMSRSVSPLRDREGRVLSRLVDYFII